MQILMSTNISLLSSNPGPWHANISTGEVKHAMFCQRLTHSANLLSAKDKADNDNFGTDKSPSLATILAGKICINDSVQE